MKKTGVVTMFVALVFLVVAGCATMEHKYIMKGQILDVNDGTAYLCIGSAEGAKVGQEFPVYRYERIPGAGGKQGTMSFKRDEVGALKITQVVHEHYAEASIIRGNVKVHDVAELSP